MNQKIAFAAIVLTLLGGFLVFGDLAFAQGESLGPLSKIAGTAGLKQNTDVPTLIGQVLGVLLSMVGVVFFLLMIYGGVLWMTARGNAQQTEKSLSIIIAAAIGLIIVLGSYAIVNLVFKSAQGQVTGTSSSYCRLDTQTIGCTASDCDGLSQSDCTPAATDGCCIWQ